MNIFYSAKSKNDLAKIDWRVREKIIADLGIISKHPDPYKMLNKLHNSNLLKFISNDFVILFEESEDRFKVVSVVKKPYIKLPEPQE